MKHEQAHAVKTDASKIEIKVGQGGINRGVNPVVGTVSKIFATLLVTLAMVLPQKTVNVLTFVSNFLFENLNWFYLYVTSGFVIFSLAIAFSPLGKVRFGADDERPEYSNISWFAMMFGAGMGVGILFYAIGGTMANIEGGPAVIGGAVASNSPEAIRSGLRYNFLHYGLHPWGIYAMVGLSLAYFSYTKRQPLTIRATLVPLFGRSLNGTFGHIIDIFAVIATLLGICTTVGLGLLQLISGLASVTGLPGLLDASAQPTSWAILLGLGLIMGLSVTSALTGVGRGVKWLSNLNLGLSALLLATFAFFGSAKFMLETLGLGLYDYLFHLPEMSFTVWERGTELWEWQSSWTVVNWAWWIAFAPFTGLFLARISRGRTIREFVLGAMIAPSLVSFLWIALLGGVAIDQVVFHGETSITQAEIAGQIFATVNVLMTPQIAQLFSGLIVLLILTFLVTSADSGVLVLNTILSGGRESHSAYLRILWGGVLTLMIGALMLAGGMDTIKQAMLIGSMPFAVIMVLMCVSTLISLRHYRREEHARR